MRLDLPACMYLLRLKVLWRCKRFADTYNIPTYMLYPTQFTYPQPFLLSKEAAATGTMPPPPLQEILHIPLVPNTGFPGRKRLISKNISSVKPGVQYQTQNSGFPVQHRRGRARRVLGPRSTVHGPRLSEAFLAASDLASQSLHTDDAGLDFRHDSGADPPSTHRLYHLHPQTIVDALAFATVAHPAALVFHR